MMPPPVPADEAARLKALHRYGILDTMPEPAFDALVKLAAHIAGTPVALLSMVDEHRQWFKARVGLAVTETPRNVSYCAHVVAERLTVYVPDAFRDHRFFDHPMAEGPRGVRFYTGIPLRTPDNHILGTLCVVDHQPRELSEAQLEALEALGEQAMHLMELRRRAGLQVRQPLEALRSMTALLLEDAKSSDFTPHQRHCLEQIAYYGEILYGALWRPEYEPRESGQAGNIWEASTAADVSSGPGDSSG